MGCHWEGGVGWKVESRRARSEEGRWKSSKCTDTPGGTSKQVIWGALREVKGGNSQFYQKIPITIVKSFSQFWVKPFNICLNTTEPKGSSILWTHRLQIFLRFERHRSLWVRGAGGGGNITKIHPDIHDQGLAGVWWAP